MIFVLIILVMQLCVLNLALYTTLYTTYLVHSEMRFM